MADQENRTPVDQARRMAAASGDRATIERLTELIDKLEGKLRAEKEGHFDGRRLLTNPSQAANILDAPCHRFW